MSERFGRVCGRGDRRGRDSGVKELRRAGRRKDERGFGRDLSLAVVRARGDG